MPEKLPSYESQVRTLLERQQAISKQLFVRGVVSRIVKHCAVGSTAISNEGFHQLRNTYVPSLRRIQDGNVVESELFLAFIDPSRKVGYFSLGRIDSIDRLYAYSDDLQSDAEEVHEMARGLQADKREGRLPDLNSHLLTINSPNDSLPRASERDFPY